MSESRTNKRTSTDANQGVSASDVYGVLASVPSLLTGHRAVPSASAVVSLSDFASQTLRSQQHQTRDTNAPPHTNRQTTSDSQSSDPPVRGSSSEDDANDEQEEDYEEPGSFDATEPKRQRAPHGPELVGLSKVPFQLIQVPLPWQHAVSRNEAKLLSPEQKSLMVQRPVRVMLCANPPCGPDAQGRLHLTPANVWFVAKDVAQLLHIHEANVARRIAAFLPHERARMPVQCMQSNGTKATLMLSVLSVHGMTRLLTASKKAVMGTRLHAYLTNYVNQLCLSAPPYASLLHNSTPVPSPSAGTISLHPSALHNLDGSPSASLAAQLYQHHTSPGSLIPLPMPAGSAAAAAANGSSQGSNLSPNSAHMQPNMPPLPTVPPIPIIPPTMLMSQSYSPMAYSPSAAESSIKTEPIDDQSGQPSAAKRQFLPQHLASASLQQQQYLQAQQHHIHQQQLVAAAAAAAVASTAYTNGYSYSHMGYSPGASPSWSPYAPSLPNPPPLPLYPGYPPPFGYPPPMPSSLPFQHPNSFGPQATLPPPPNHPRCTHQFNPNCGSCVAWSRYDGMAYSLNPGAGGRPFQMQPQMNFGMPTAGLSQQQQQLQHQQLSIANLSHHEAPSSPPTPHTSTPPFHTHHQSTSISPASSVPSDSPLLHSMNASAFGIFQPSPSRASTAGLTNGTPSGTPPSASVGSLSSSVTPVVPNGDAVQGQNQADSVLKALGDMPSTAVSGQMQPPSPSAEERPSEEAQTGAEQVVGAAA